MNLLQTHPIFFHIHGVTITAHGLFFALGALLATFFVVGNRRTQRLSFNDALERCVVIFIVGLLGARLGYIVAYPATWQTLGDIVAFWHGGLVSFTGILAGLYVMLLYTRRAPVAVKQQWYALIVQATLLGWSVGRLGNYYAGESGGVASNIWQVTYGHVPIQLFEALGCFLLFLYLRYGPLTAAQKVYGGIGGYLGIRFIVDFWRNEYWIGLHVSQWVTLVCFIVLGIVMKTAHDRQTS